MSRKRKLPVDKPSPIPVKTNHTPLPRLTINSIDQLLASRKRQDIIGRAPIFIGHATIVFAYLVRNPVNTGLDFTSASDHDGIDDGELLEEGEGPGPLTSEEAQLAVWKFAQPVTFPSRFTIQHADTAGQPPHKPLIVPPKAVLITWEQQSVFMIKAQTICGVDRMDHPCRAVFLTPFEALKHRDILLNKLEDLLENVLGIRDIPSWPEWAEHWDQQAFPLVAKALLLHSANGYVVLKPVWLVRQQSTTVEGARHGDVGTIHGDDKQVGAVQGIADWMEEAGFVPTQSDIVEFGFHYLHGESAPPLPRRKADHNGMSLWISAPSGAFQTIDPAISTSIVNRD